jgi:hypothetical protein
MGLLQGRGVLPAIVLVLTAAAGLHAQAQMSAPASLSAAQIVEQMERHNQKQAQALNRYRAIRHYQAEYHGFATTVEAKMEVEASFDAATGKSFHVLSQSGSKLLCEKVLKRAVDSETKASRDKGSTALTTANYKFQLLGTESLNGRLVYVLEVAPWKESKYLYRGRIWVDATDFAVARIEASPAKSPSFWISRTLIRYTSAKIGDFWLPQMSRSETKVRIGGTAVLTIDYGTYQIVPEMPARNAGD